MAETVHESVSSFIGSLQEVIDVSEGYPRPEPVYLSAETENLSALNVSARSISYRIDVSRDVLFIHAVCPSEVLFGAMVPQSAIRRHRGCWGRHSPGKPDRRMVRFRWRFASTDSANDFTHFIERVASISPEVRVRAVVMINPVSGTRQSGKVWERAVFPLLEESKRFEIIAVHYTNHSGHAMEIIQALELTTNPVDAIIALGGDGLVNEIFNGIFLGYPSSYREILGRTTVCPLPSGTGNGLCWSTLCAAGEPFSLNCALRQLIRFRTGKRDLGQVEYSDEFDVTDVQTRLFSLTISWGLVADVDIRSEKLRMFGDSRFAVYGIAKILQRKTYSGTLELGDGDSEILPDVITVYATIVPVAGRTIIFDPAIPLDSGNICVYKFLARDLSRMQLMHAMDELAKVRNHEQYIPGFVPARVPSFELTPDLRGSGGAGIVLDGEPLTKGPVRVFVLPKVTNCLVD